MSRYTQQIQLSEIGTDGQALLSASSVLIIGAGGLGTVVAAYLGAMGVGSIGICDFDLIEPSNLHRQFLYTPDDIGKKKATVLAQKISLQNPEIKCSAIDEKIEKETLEKMASPYQLICDCTDNATARVFIDNYCALKQKPLIHGAVSEWHGFVTVFHYKSHLGLNSLFDKDEYAAIQSCTALGVNPAVCGIIGSYVANEALKIILDLPHILEGSLLYVNTLQHTSKLLKLQTA